MMVGEVSVHGLDQGGDLGAGLTDCEARELFLFSRTIFQAGSVNVGNVYRAPAEVLTV
ncbi:hypothetical protein NJL88_28960 [Streptomyces sp. DK15]|uniref:hypothetical protein n=1 Tax=Streptomyces sp. DK15 TaxID=2957499 RepID=UPI0029A219B6|nr:hypothetical protein [Streptomyces sp. DK15]MDX2394024.1 hypothetical protein [Streptomyces sp. DK15]